MAQSSARIAVLGAGLIGRRHVDHVCQQAQLCAIVDPDPQAQKLAASLNVPHFTAVEEMINAQRPDGVIVATPNQMHRDHAVLCIGAGIPVLVEKPIADTVEAAQAICDAAEENGVAVLVGHHRRHNPLVRAAQKMAHDGTLGTIVAAQTMCWFNKPSDYFNVEWRKQPGAGPVFINLIHDVDLLLHYCGPVSAVQAMESNATREFAVEDTAVVSLRFKSGALGTITLSDTISSPWSWELASAENPAYPQMDVGSTMLGGTQASLSIPDLKVWQHENGQSWWNPMSAKEIEIEPADPLVLQMQHFLDIVAGTAKPLVTAADGLRALKVTMAIKQAAQSGDVVEL